MIEPKFAMPRITDIIDDMTESKFSTTLDSVAGFNRILVHHDSRDKISIITECGTFRYEVLPFGINQASTVFQQTMTTLFADILGRDVSMYVDDLIIGQKNFDDHLQAMKRVLKRLYDANFTVNLNKCKFCDAVR